MILREFALKEYDPFSLLMIARGRCAQDDCYLVPLKEEEYPEELQTRLRKKISELIHVSPQRELIILGDGTVSEINIEILKTGNNELRRLLSYYHGLSDLRVSPGGQGVEWDEERYIPNHTLFPALEPAELVQKDLIAYIQNNLVDTGEAAAMLSCSRQNIRDLIRRGKLKLVREEGNNSLFLKRDILARLRD